MGATDHRRSKAELIEELDSLRRYVRRLEDPSASTEADDLYRRLLRFLPDAVRISCDGVIVYANDAAAALFGAPTADALIGRASGDFVPEDDRERVDDRRRMLRVAGHLPVEETRKLRLDGTMVDAEASTILIDWRGRPADLTVMRDISDRVADRHRLVESEAQLAALAGNIPGAAYQCVLRVDGGIVFPYLGLGAQDLFGTACGQAEADGNVLLERLHPEDRAAFRQSLHDSAASMTITDMEFRVLGRDGGVRWVRSTARPRIRDEATGSAVLWDGVFLDVTDRRVAADGLRAAKEAAELADRTKSAFLASMSHELRTPLNAIMGFSEVIEAELFGPVGSPRYAEYARDIHNSGQHLLALINDILDLSKVEAGKLELHEEVIDVASVIEESLAFLKRRAESGKIRLAVSIAAKLPHLRADERRLRQILLNLLSNASKYTPDGGTVRISVEASTGAGMAISVTDTGIGMTAADRDRALTPFGQVDNALNRAGQGTGLGLPLARSLVERHGGHIDLDSRPGEGTRVTVRFPAMRLVA